MKSRGIYLLPIHCALLFQGSNAISQILVQKLGVLQQIIPLFKSSNQNLQKAAVSLLGNLSRTTWLQPSMGKKKHEMRVKHDSQIMMVIVLLSFSVFSSAKSMIPTLANLFNSGPRGMGNSDETIATTCNTLKGLMLADTESAKKVMNVELVTSLLDLTEDRYGLCMIYELCLEMQNT